MMAVAWERGELSQEGTRYTSCTEKCQPIGFWDAAARLFRIFIAHDIPGHEANVMRGDRAGVVWIRDLRIDLGRLRVTVGGRDVRLTSREWRCLEYLAQNADRVVSTRELTRAVYGAPTLDALNENYARTNMDRLRKKIGDRGERLPGGNAWRFRYIQTLHGFGYRLCEESPV